MKNTGVVYLDSAGNILKKGMSVFCTLPHHIRGEGVRSGTLFRCTVVYFSNKTCTVQVNDESVKSSELVRRYYDEVICENPHEFD